MDRDEGRDRDVAVAELLEDDRRIEARQRRSADVLLHVEARKSQLGGLAEHVHGQGLLLVPPRGVGGQLCRGEGARGVLDGPLVLGQVEIHGRG